MQRQWDIFCTIIDNFGDIGVCWRLARQLTQDHHQVVRLWVDDLTSFSCVAPDVNPEIQQQVVQGVEICHWQYISVEVEPAEVVIEAFACELPDVYVAALLQRKKQPVWINLEYLSAEPWVVQCHGLPSPHPRLPLVKTFFFPGFVQGTGGLLREKNLIARRSTFSPTAERAFLQRKDLLARKPDEIRISLFCYDTAPVTKLIRVLSESSKPVLLIVPEGSVAGNIASQLNNSLSQTGKLIQHGQLTVRIIPFMEQTDYDRLLWSCDFNFVRGEDSFVRAQWAGNPFVWNIYPQTEGTHWKKLDAFLELYTANMPEDMTGAVREIWACWSGRYEINSTIWLNFLFFRESITQHNKRWVRQLLEQVDLASSLVQFAENRL
ncbi:elongation factor P maturation arginine rhamnosyltransferase EarP [Nitrosomonas sp.]|uniref:elongation factor P maturation arginine rhamnosyltransferase EarP n=1 Tax=Nitrosomonas sp. TaxID=42353 RepID=UPI0025F12B68|nr:elongation factor P maturation arginine rhamnosyltransferase EarP [Nitrosomonas sp.]MBY0483709.1 elongation factor P maturation arginine rhamnosyltransferase EarP [Nitrosomonas sp.]